jgi:hypothetical protein
MKHNALHFGIAAFLVSIAMTSQPAAAKMMVVTAETPACTSWAGWREWVQASLRPKGARFNEHCPTSIAKGTKIDVIEEDDGEGAARVMWRGKEWYTHAERLK